MESSEKIPAAAAAELGKKLWKVARIVFLMMKKSISKAKLILDLKMLLNRGKIAGKALSCRSRADHSLSFISPRQYYEFSYTNTPVNVSNRKQTRQRRYRYHHHVDVQKAFEIINNDNDSDEASATAVSPMVLPGFGFGKSPMVRELRVTDSPFSLQDADEDAHVDKAAEDFINKFYKELRHQNSLATQGSPSPYHVYIG